MGKAGEINPLGCDNENISYNSLMEIMGVVSERLQANTDTIKHDMINWLTKLRKQLLEADGGHTEADLQRELSRKSKLLDAYLDGILNKQEYQKKAEELDERIIQLKAETEKNKANSGDIAEIDKVLANIDEEVSRYVDGNEKLKVEYLLEHLEQVQIFPDKNVWEHGGRHVKIVLSEQEGEACLLVQNEVMHPEYIDVERIFERFYKADLARSTTSSGLGMAIARQLVEQMNGQITADLQENIFSICLQFVCIRS